MSPAGNAHNVENRVSEIRNERGMTQEELAKMTGLTRQSIIAIEKKRFTPSIQTVLLLASALEFKVDDLFWLKNEKQED